MAGRHRLNGRRVITKRRGMEMVDNRTLVAHMLSDAAAVAGRRGGGRYFALCGAQVIPASLTAAPEGGYCRPCTVTPTPVGDAVTTRPDGFPVWISEVEVRRHPRHHRRPRAHPRRPLRRCRQRTAHPRRPGYEGAGQGVHTPVKQPADRSEPDINTRTRNMLLRSLRLSRYESGQQAAVCDRCHQDIHAGRATATTRR
ncbi:MAG: hypothetical protein ACRDRK_27425 [Pseudonocardia sp.]